MDVPGSGRGFERSSALQRRLHELVPGGAHTYARGSDQYPEGMAPILVRGDGCRVWDADGNCFIEYGMGLRSVTLGHGYRPVLDAVHKALADGVNFSRPTGLEVAAAEDFLSLVPGADMVKFAKNGSDATTAAIRLARAVTGRDMVAVCDQPFFSADDWFIGAVEMNSGVPEATRNQTVRFQFNDLDSLRLRFAESGGQIACVVMEAATALAEPEPGFLEGVRALCDAHGSLLVFDEMITGFRWSASGAQTVYGVRPDLSCWGKAMGNGFPISALAGRRELMELGGLNTESPRVFLLSTTHGPETVSLAAFRAVVRAYADGDPVGIMERRGTLLADGVNTAARELGVEEFVAAIGRPSCMVFTTRDPDGRPSQPFRTLFMQELLRRGVLGQSFVISAAHTVADVEHTVAATREALKIYRRALEDGGVDRFLDGRPVAPALRSLASPRQL
ncbi:glutamate-1-semialdehyde 2,1-aminomutase [Kutzneria chonburiensis]|uniref:Glutamate-1-semialdehyde 2,1-aminomutase n=1 Tax=Kutzneria chonburiensis TaxID=1483604 RepID=A0ABV6N9C6_9PSEU